MDLCSPALATQGAGNEFFLFSVVRGQAEDGSFLPGTLFPSRSMAGVMLTFEPHLGGPWVHHTRSFSSRGDETVSYWVCTGLLWKTTRACPALCSQPHLGTAEPRGEGAASWSLDAHTVAGDLTL
jgi:hypothetical protein